MSRFQTRLQHNRLRFNELNSEVLTYQHEAEAPVSITASPIFKRSFIQAAMMSLIKAERQHWAIDLNQTDPLTLVPFTVKIPSVGDTLTTIAGDVYRVQLETEDTPHFQFITSSRNRIMVYTVLQSQA